MRRQAMQAALLPILAASLAIPFANAQQVKAVFERNGELFTLDSNGAQKQLTHDGVPKDTPLWSKDGTRIAYLADVDKSRALAEMMAIDAADGAQLSDILIRPRQPGEGQDMRFIETLEWLTPQKIAASGSINPSTEESLVLDLETGKELINYYDDEGGTAYSPDGQHVAYVNGAPHFLPAEDSSPALNIDLKKVFPSTGIQVDFLSRALWTSDGSTVGIVAKIRATGAVSLVLCKTGAACAQTPLPAAATEARFALERASNGLVARSGSASWSVSENAAAASPGGTSFKQQARALVEGMREKIHAAGGHSEDFWCADCVLSLLPRKSGLLEN